MLWCAALAYYDSYGVFALFAATIAITAASIVFFVLLERAIAALQAADPKIVTIYDPLFLVA